MMRFDGCLIGRVNTTDGLRPMAPQRGAAAHSAAPRTDGPGRAR